MLLRGDESPITGSIQADIRHLGRGDVVKGLNKCSFQPQSLRIPIQHTRRGHHLAAGHCLRDYTLADSLNPPNNPGRRLSIALFCE